MLPVTVLFLTTEWGNEVKICVWYHRKPTQTSALAKTVYTLVLAMVFISLFNSLCASQYLSVNACLCNPTGNNQLVVLTFLSHLYIFLAGDVPAPGTLDSSGIAVKLAVPRLLQEKKLQRNSNVTSLAFCTYMCISPYPETTASHLSHLKQNIKTWTLTTLLADIINKRKTLKMVIIILHSFTLYLFNLKIMGWQNILMSLWLKF